MVKSVDAGNRPRVLNPQDKQVGSSIAVLNYQKKRHVTNFDTSRILDINKMFGQHSERTTRTSQIYHLYNSILSQNRQRDCFFLKAYYFVIFLFPFLDTLELLM